MFNIIFEKIKDKKLKRIPFKMKINQSIYFLTQTERYVLKLAITEYLFSKQE